MCKEARKYPWRGENQLVKTQVKYILPNEQGRTLKCLLHQKCLFSWSWRILSMLTCKIEMQRLWKKNLLCIRELWSNFNSVKIYVNGIPQDVKDRRIEQRTA